MFGATCHKHGVGAFFKCRKKKENIYFPRARQFDNFYVRTLIDRCRRAKIGSY